jgi:hypothetical protein
MKIRFTNPFLLTVGTALVLGSLFINHSVLIAFLGGCCFGLILLNIDEAKKK